jgi:hypothetical protein
VVRPATVICIVVITVLFKDGGVEVDWVEEVTHQSKELRLTPLGAKIRPQTLRGNQKRNKEE